MTKEQNAVQYLHSIVEPLCKKPDELEIIHHVDEGGLGIVVNVLASDEDLSLLIGTRGVMAKSIRRLLRGWCDLNMARVIMHIGKPFESTT